MAEPPAPGGRLARPPGIRPGVQRWARQLVGALTPLVGRVVPAQAHPRLLVIFLDGVGRRLLRQASHDGSMPFLASLRDGPSHRELSAFSGMPSTTTAFQAGLFFGLDHPDIPAFGWLDRSEGALLQMNTPSDAARMERALRGRAGPGLFRGGSSYLSILAGGSEGALSTAGLARLQERWGQDPAAGAAPFDLGARALLAARTVARVGARLARETPAFLADMVRASSWLGSTRHELGFLLNHIGVGTVAAELAKSAVILDLIRGVPRSFLCIHDYDEHAHRRGPAEARSVLPRIDRTVEALFAVAGASPNPPEIWVLADHGHIAAIPFERIFGCTLEDWLAGAHDRDPGGPALPSTLMARYGAHREPGRATSADPHPPPRVVSCGNYAHVYLGGAEAWDVRRIAQRRPHVLARALDCPGVGLVAMRDGDGAVAFQGPRQVDPLETGTLPRPLGAQAVRSLLAELAASPSSGDLLLFGSWLGDASIAFSWELSSHGGPSPEETETFVLHPAGVDPGSIGHGADLHRVLRSRYTPSTA